MKFTCDSCSAQYMISDEKVGPTGVKVRCKKCGNVVLVRRAPEEAAAVASAAARPAGGPGLDVELGNAFDNVFRDPPGESPAPAGSDPGATQAMGSEDEARIAAAPAQPAEPPAPAPTEWYVAIGQAQVGPLPLVEVKRKWEAGDVGPDSLVWRPGMADWRPVTAVAELAGYLAPVPRSSPQPARAEHRPASREPHGARERSGAAPEGEVSWKPAGASALAALANEEIAARNAPEKPASPQVAAAGGVKSLVDGLPDGGGVDPTGALPLSIKALETTGEKKLDRRSTIAHRAEEARHRRSVTRAVVIGVLVVAVVGSAAGGALWYMNQKRNPPPAVAAAPVPAAEPAPPAAPPATPPAAPAPAAAAPEIPNPPPPALPPERAVAAAPEPAAPPPTAKAAPPPPARPARAQPARTSRREPAPERIAAAPPPAEAPAPTPAPPPARKKGLPDFESNDSALDEALGGGGSGTGRTVYVPPARSGNGTNGSLPEKLSPAQINEAVASRIDPLRRCVTEQKEREPGATGVLKMRWIIAGDGGVRDVKCLTPEYAQGPFAQCITGVVKTIKFPRSGTAGQEVTFPFQF